MGQKKKIETITKFSCYLGFLILDNVRIYPIAETMESSEEGPFGSGCAHGVTKALNSWGGVTAS